MWKALDDLCMYVCICICSQGRSETIYRLKEIPNSAPLLSLWEHKNLTKFIIFENYSGNFIKKITSLILKNLNIYYIFLKFIIIQIILKTS